VGEQDTGGLACTGARGIVGHSSLLLYLLLVGVHPFDLGGIEGIGEAKPPSSLDPDNLLPVGVLQGVGPCLVSDEDEVLAVEGPAVAAAEVEDNWIFSHHFRPCIVVFHHKYHRSQRTLHFHM